MPETFPNSAVIRAYKEAKVDQNRDKFTYGQTCSCCAVFALTDLGGSKTKLMSCLYQCSRYCLAVVLCTALVCSSQPASMYLWQQDRADELLVPLLKVFVCVSVVSETVGSC